MTLKAKMWMYIAIVLWVAAALLWSYGALAQGATNCTVTGKPLDVAAIWVSDNLLDTPGLINHQATSPYSFTETVVRQYYCGSESVSCSEATQEMVACPYSTVDKNSVAPKMYQLHSLYRDDKVATDSYGNCKIIRNGTHDTANCGIRGYEVFVNVVSPVPVVPVRSFTAPPAAAPSVLPMVVDEIVGFKAEDATATWCGELSPSDLTGLAGYTYGNSLAATLDNSGYFICAGFGLDEYTNFSSGCPNHAEASTVDADGNPVLVSQWGLEYRAICVVPIGTPENTIWSMLISVGE